MLKTFNFDKAARLAREGLRHEPDHAGCLYVATLVDVISGRQSSEHLRRMLIEHPEHVRSSVALVVALSDKGRPRDALRVAQELLRSQPDSEQFVDLVREFKMQSHWSMLPLYPMQRWGWGGAAVLTVVGIVGVRAIGDFVPENVAAAIALTWFGYIVYSWVWPPLLRRMM